MGSIEYGTSSYLFPARTLESFIGMKLCPNGHSNLTLIKETRNILSLKCEICGVSFKTPMFQIPKDKTKK